MKFDFQTADRLVEADWPVVINVPLDGGKVERRTFTARFRLLRPDDLDAVMADNKDGRGLERMYWIGFGKDEDMQLTPEVFKISLDLPYFRNGLQAAYQAFSGGIEVKN